MGAPAGTARPTAPRLLAIAPPGWQEDLPKFRRQLQHFAEVAASLGPRAAVYLRAHDHTEVEWRTWLQQLAIPQLAPLRVGVTPPRRAGTLAGDDALLDDARLHDLLLSLGIAFVHLPAAHPAEPWLTLRTRPGCQLALSRACHAPQWQDQLEFDWRVISPVLPTPTKPGTPALGLERLAQVVQQAGGPVVALGGIDARTARQVLATGVAGIASLRAAWDDLPGRVARGHGAAALVQACLGDPSKNM